MLLLLVFSIRKNRQLNYLLVSYHIGVIFNKESSRDDDSTYSNENSILSIEEIATRNSNSSKNFIVI